MPDINRAIDTCLDPEALCPHLQTALALHGLIEAVRITKAHRSASLHRDPNPLKFCVEADLRGGETLKLYGKVYRAGASAQAAQGSDALHVPELDLLLWLWPSDPGLSQLAHLLEPAVAQPFWGASAADVQIPRYEPERRATLRYTHADGRVLYAKTFCDTRGQTVHRRFAWMWERSQQDADAPLVARPLQCSVDGRTLWQEAAQGTPLLQLPIGAQVSAQPNGDWVLPLAHAIATVHAAPLALAGPSPRDCEHWRAEVHRRRNKISRVRPELTELADATANAIVHAAAHLPAHTPTLIHGDFHPDQVWFDGRRIVLFDFDEFALGDPMEDLAEFIVKLPDGGTSSHTNAQLVALWLGGYAQIAPQHFCRQRLRWHMAVQQLLQSTRAFIFQIDDWRGEVQRRLERAHELATQIDAEETI
jgi:Ser/Thr protein kinase RdoA (MazF antagonist)